MHTTDVQRALVLGAPALGSLLIGGTAYYISCVPGGNNVPNILGCFIGVLLWLWHVINVCNLPLSLPQAEPCLKTTESRESTTGPMYYTDEMFYGAIAHLKNDLQIAKYSQVVDYIYSPLQRLAIGQALGDYRRLFCGHGTAAITTYPDYRRRAIHIETSCTEDILQADWQMYAISAAGGCVRAELLHRLIHHFVIVVMAVPALEFEIGHTDHGGSFM